MPKSTSFDESSLLCSVTRSAPAFMTLLARPYTLRRQKQIEKVYVLCCMGLSARAGISSPQETATRTTAHLRVASQPLQTACPSTVLSPDENVCNSVQMEVLSRSSAAHLTCPYPPPHHYSYLLPTLQLNGISFRHVGCEH